MARLVRTRRNGTTIFYSLENDHVRQLVIDAVFNAEARRARGSPVITAAMSDRRAGCKQSPKHEQPQRISPREADNYV